MIVSTIFYIFLILLAIVLLCLAAVWIEKMFPGKQYDERQVLSRSKAHRLAYWVGFLYYMAVVMILLYQVDGERTVEPYLLVLGGIFLQEIVIHTYCLITHAALPLSQNAAPSIVGFFIMGVMNLLAFWGQYQRYGVMRPVGHSTITYIYLVSGIGFMYLAVLHLIQALRKDED